MRPVLLVDHRDSFVHNVEQIIMEEGYAVATLRQEELSLSAVERLRPSAIVLSPGPGNPHEQRDRFKTSIEIVRKFAGKVPMLGICLGMQIMNVALGGTLRRAKRIYHGVVDEVLVVNGGPLFFGLPEKFKATRYHSLVIDRLGEGLVVEALSASDGEIMAVRHEEHKLFGLQFHPESIGTLPLGQAIIRNFLALSRPFSLF